jgi:hypothetical protein
MKKTILTHLEKMEFVCGLKQFKEYKIEEAEQLLDCLNKLFSSFGKQGLITFCTQAYGVNMVTSTM